MSSPLPAQSPTVDPLVGLYALVLLLALGGLGYLLWRRWRSRRELVARLAELTQLADLGGAILGAQRDSARLAELIYERAGQIVDTTFFQLGLYEGDQYRMLIWVFDGQRRDPLRVRLTPASLGIVGWMRASHQPLLVRDFETELETLPARPRYISTDPPRSAVFVPLLAGDRALGALAIQSRRPAAFSEEHLRLLSIIANTASAALETARLFEQTQRRAAQLELLAEVGRRINVLQPLPAFYRQAVHLLGEQFREYQVSVFILEPAGLRLAATTRPDPPSVAAWLALGEGPVGEAAVAQRTIVREAATEALSEAALAEGLAEIAVPLRIEARVLGVLSVQSQTAVFDEAALSWFESLAAQMAFATLEAQVYAAEQRRAEQLSALAQASRSVASTLELDDLLEGVVELVGERFGYRRARIFLAQDDRLVWRAGSDQMAAPKRPLTYALNGPGLIAAAGRQQTPLLVADVLTHPDYRAGPGLEDTRTEMIAPLVMAGRLVGVFDVQSELPNAFTPDDLQTLATLGDTLAVAVRNARLFEAERRRRRLAETLREVSDALTSTFSLDGVLDLILTGLARVVNYDVASILLVNDFGELCLRAVRGPQSLARDWPLGQPIDIPLFPRGTPPPASLNFAEVDTGGAYHALFDLPDPHACLGAALVLQDEHLGYLVVDRAETATFPAEEAELIAAFAAQAAVAIENARLYTAQREQAWVSTALLQVAAALAQTPDLEAALETVVRVTPLLVGVQWSVVLLAADDAFGVRAFYHAGDGLAPAVALGGGLGQWPKLAEMIEAEAPVVQSPEDHAPPALAPLLENGVALLLPLWVRGLVQGALIVGQAADDQPFTAQRVRLIGGIANQASLALESALLGEAQQEEAWVNTALLQVAEAVASQPTLDEALETVARLTPMLVGVTRAAIFRWDGPAERFRLGQQAGLSLAAGAELVALAAELGVDAFAPSNTSGLCKLPARLAQAFATELVMVWPLWARGDLRGTLVVEHVIGLGRRLNILNGIAHQLAMAMENAALAHEVAQQQRLEQEMALGRDIQASFLPEACPQAPGWEVAAFWRSARLVGGDFYDFIRLQTSDGVERWGLVIADVSDKGVPAALFMALSRTLLRSAAIRRASPAATLTRVNELILADARSQQFVTVFYGVWEPATGRLTYANGGHNPPVLARASGELYTLPSGGAVLGVFAEYLYHEHELVIQPGDTLLLYTDGLTDAIDAAQREFGLERVNDLLRQTRPYSAQVLLATMEAAVEAHVGAVEAFDDMTMVVLKRLASAEPE